MEQKNESFDLINSIYLDQAIYIYYKWTVFSAFIAIFLLFLIIIIFRLVRVEKINENSND